MHTLYYPLSSRREFPSIENQGTIRKWVIFAQLACFYGETDGSGTHLQEIRRLGQIHPTLQRQNRPKALAMPAEDPRRSDDARRGSLTEGRRGAKRGAKEDENVCENGPETQTTGERQI
jgi:hypothetical protein